MLESDEPDTDVDRLARVLAANAGHVWDQLAPYPGYLRNLFRGETRKMLGRLSIPIAA